MKWLDAAPPPAPVVRVQEDEGGVHASWTPSEGEAAVAWSIAVRSGGEDGRWTLAVAPPGERTFTARGDAVTALVVRAVDRCGNLSEARVWAR
jgi:hypothetical protein